MIANQDAVLRISARFEGLEFHHMVRDSNQAADLLARIGAKRDPVPKNVFLEWLFKPSVTWEGSADSSNITATKPGSPPIDESDDDIVGGSVMEETPSAHEVMAVIAPWTEPFLAYLIHKELPEDQTEARCLVRQSKAYKIDNGELYRKSPSGVLQRCISEEEGRQLLAEVHAGMAGHHVGARSLVSKAFHAGFYWPTHTPWCRIASDVSSSQIKATCP
jgi:hypothetical protein